MGANVLEDEDQRAGTIEDQDVGEHLWRTVRNFHPH